jgi:uncharacterized membrane protein YsdA (DUF1294 family)
METQQRTCLTCGASFTWTSGEQRFYRERGLQAPRRCPACREQRRAQAAARPDDGRAADTLLRPPAPHTGRDAARRSQRIVVGWLAGIAGIAALALSLALIQQARLPWLGGWLIAVNLLALLIYGYDKTIAGSGVRRVPERTLLAVALLGGTLGALAGMLLFRHKTRKPAFLIPFVVLAIVQSGAIAGWLAWSGAG